MIIAPQTGVTRSKLQFVQIFPFLTSHLSVQQRGRFARVSFVRLELQLQVANLLKSIAQLAIELTVLLFQRTTSIVLLYTISSAAMSLYMLRGIHTSIEYETDLEGPFDATGDVARDVALGFSYTGVATGSGCGAGALVVLVGVGAMGVVAADGGGPEKTAPFSRLTYLGAAVFPEKNSPAEREGSEAGAGGKMSDWKESAWQYSQIIFEI